MQVQIPKDLLMALFQYHLAGNEDYLPEIEKAFLAECAYEYFVRDSVTYRFVFDEIAAMSRRGDGVKKISCLAYAKYFAENPEEVVKRAVRSIEKYSENQSDEKYMMVQSGGSHMKVFLKDIVYAEVYNRKVIIHTRDTNIEYYGKLQELSEIAGADFFRTHRAYLVHFKYVQKYDANCVTMENGTALIAKQNYSEFVKQYLKYNQRKGKEIG